MQINLKSTRIHRFDTISQEIGRTLLILHKIRRKNTTHKSPVKVQRGSAEFWERPLHLSPGICAIRQQNINQSKITSHTCQVQWRQRKMHPL